MTYYDEVEEKLEEYVKNSRINWKGMGSQRGRWGIHICPLDAECRFWGTPKRMQIKIPWGIIFIGLWPGNGAQLWLPFKGYIMKGSPIAFHPNTKKKND